MSEGAPEQDLLAPYQAAIEATALAIIGAEVLNDPPSTADSSQLGGQPWWPADRAWPADRQGKPLFLLVQINFAEAPPVAPLPCRGLLQIFIGSDDLYGCAFEDAASSACACVFHEDFSGPRLTDLSFLTFGDDDMSPLEEPLRAHALRLSVSRMPIDPSDFRMDQLLPEIVASRPLFEAYYARPSAPAIRLGGYPSFTQSDPRSYGDPSKIGDFTLLTLDTTDGVMWGDAGAAQFLMSEEDLRRRDFSKVYYNWDCC